MSYHQRSIPPTEDRISSLPDSILSHILSFLPTKLASSTSLLSKRWKPLWLSSLTLTLDTQSFKDFSAFRLFVYSLFMSRDYNLPIQSLHLRCCYTPDCDPHVLNRIVSAAVQRGGIQNISFCIEIIENIDLRIWKILLNLVPCIFSILNCTRTTLVVLKLKCFVIIDIPPIVDLPLLKTLHLEKTWFACDYILQRLLFGCPNLENLHLSISRFSSKGNINGSESEGKYKHLDKLVTAKLFISGCMLFPFDWVHNAKFLRVHLLKSCVYKSPTFHNNVIDMELIFDSEKLQAEWKWVIEVLKHCPKLQNLTIDHKVFSSKKVQEVTGGEDWMDPKTVPECLLYQLKTCLLRNYKGMKGELQFAEYIMQNSKQLGTMTVKSSCAVDKNAKLQMIVKLSLCSRGSGTCKLLFD